MSLYVVVTQANRGGGPKPGAPRRDVLVATSERVDAASLDIAIEIASEEYRLRYKCQMVHCFGTYEAP